MTLTRFVIFLSLKVLYEFIIGFKAVWDNIRNFPCLKVVDENNIIIMLLLLYVRVHIYLCINFYNLSYYFIIYIFRIIVCRYMYLVFSLLLLSKM